MHVPNASSEAAVPEIVQTAGVVETKVTASPEVAVAESITVDPATWPDGTVAIEMVCNA
jgi:hypothetical protein